MTDPRPSEVQALAEKIWEAQREFNAAWEEAPVGDWGEFVASSLHARGVRVAPSPTEDAPWPCVNCSTALAWCGNDLSEAACCDNCDHPSVRGVAPSPTELAALLHPYVCTSQRVRDRLGSHDITGWFSKPMCEAASEAVAAFLSAEPDRGGEIVADPLVVGAPDELSTRVATDRPALGAQQDRDVPSAESWLPDRGGPVAPERVAGGGDGLDSVDHGDTVTRSRYVSSGVAPSPDAPGRNAAIEAVAAILRNDLNVGSYDRARLVPAIVDAALAASGDAPREDADCDDCRGKPNHWHHAAALHPVSDATPDLAAALEDAAWSLYWNVTDAAGNRYTPNPRVLAATRAVLDDVRARRLASEPVPATPACICGRAAPVAGTCFDIDGAYWSGHGEPVPATCIGCDFTGNTAAVSYINPKCPVHGTVPATGNPENPVTFSLDVLDAMHEVALQIGLDLVGHFDRDHTKAETRDAMGDISIRLSKWANVFQRLGHSTVNGRNTPPTRYMRHMAAGAPPPPAEDVIENALRSATGNPEEIDALVEAARHLSDLYDMGAGGDDWWGAHDALRDAVARQREGERP